VSLKVKNNIIGGWLSSLVLGVTPQSALCAGRSSRQRQLFLSAGDNYSLPVAQG
jgi:hypothetical protein